MSRQSHQSDVVTIFSSATTAWHYVNVTRNLGGG